MGFGWVGYEARSLGRLGLAMPPVVLLLFGGMAWLVGAADAPVGRVGRVVTAGLEPGLPLAAGSWRRRPSPRRGRSSCTRRS